ncbi:hypothetical protein K458DRAFT_351264 [Lentithecium fluviatile CBS 122367]|uniref:Macro domain-containing protein n=1 Tax=Lentithecium fluviatile CBS 122367 TaxID=1168545 RepID=A0A6G1IFI2_9PLEO|nr:hypothetical protein K458DRAFT_351264 [Lentithecium fluviatile CBS 122367]
MSAIRLGTAANVRGFQELLSALSKTSHTLDHEALQDEFGRLRVWSGNIGALQKGHSSLDYRLRDSPLLSSNVLKLLQELEENLAAAVSIVSGARLPYEEQPQPEKNNEDDDDFFSEDEDDNSEARVPKTELDMRFGEIQDIVDNLYRISVRIRQPTIKSRSLKAASYRPKDPDTGVDILDQYAFFDLQYTRELVSHLRTAHASNPDEPHNDKGIIVNRLARAVTLRRRQFKYWSRHRQKLGVFTSLEEPQAPQKVERPEVLHRNDTLEAQPELPVPRNLNDAPSQKTGKTLLSGTEATHHHQSLDDIVDSKSVTSYATTVRDLTGKGIDLPSPPKAADGEKDFECPYCFIICPARYGKGRPWRTHVLQDLQPYLCTYEECELPDQLFRSRKEWIQHEASHRKAWRCPEHPAAVFKSRIGLRGHLQQKHGENFPESQLDSIVNVGETSTVDTRPLCPICYTRADTEGMNFQNHLANHLERIAAFALPKNSDDDADGASSQASRGRTDSVGSQALSDVSPVSDEDEDDGAEDLELNASNQSLAHDTSLSAARSNEMLPVQALSAELLRDLPDARQDRLNILLASHRGEDHGHDDVGRYGTPAGVEKHMADMEAFRKYLMTLPGAQSVRFYRRYGPWRGNAHFKDEPSATAALNLFDKDKYPEVTLRQHDKKTSLKFSVPQEDRGDKAKPHQPRTYTNEPESLSNSSTSTYASDEEQETSEETRTVLADEVPAIRSLYRSGILLQREQSYAPNDSYNQIISFCFSSLIRLKVDAIVNSSNRSMKMEKFAHTLNNTVHKAAGPELQKETKGFSKMKTGQATITKGYRLPGANIIHVARPDYRGDKGMGQYNILSECYRSALRLAVGHKLKTVAFPLLGAGGCGFPPRVAARVALQEVREFLDTHKGHPFEKIIFAAYSTVEEKAFMDFLPVFFPPTHGDVENTVPSGSARMHGSRTHLAEQLGEAQNQVDTVARGLVDLVEHIVDLRSGKRALAELTAIMSVLGSMEEALLGPGVTIKNLDGRIPAYVEQICNVMIALCGSVTEIMEQGKAKALGGEPSYRVIWQDYNSYMKSYQRLDLIELLELCQDFAQSLEDILVRDGEEPYEMGAMSIRLESWLAKQTDKGNQSVQSHFDEVLYTRQFQQGESTPRRTDTVKLHQLPSLARMYQVGELEQKQTFAVPSSRINHIVGLVREDITRLEVDIIVNSTNPTFSGTGTLSRTVEQKGGLGMQQELNSFGICEEGTVRVTRGYGMPAKHVLHVVPPRVYRTNSKDILRKIYREILHTAVSLKASSVAIPSIGTGMLSYPAGDCASLAMEEVKGFLGSMEFTTIEKIIFVVFTSSDEYIYKSLLPVYFPPIDVNVNKALLPRDVNRPPSTAASDPPRRSLFSSIGEAFRSVRFGKQPATVMERPLAAAEKHALESFERHARGCPTCIDIQRAYVREGHLCVEGHSAAQNVLQYLYMDADQTVYSTNLEDGRKTRVEVPLEYSLSWILLTTVQKSFRDEDRRRPFIGPNQPWAGLEEQQQATEAIPPGVTIYNAEVTIPREPEKAMAIVHVWSDERQFWEALQSLEASLHIFPGRLRVYANEYQTEAQVPLLSLELTPLVQIESSSSLEVTISKARTFPEVVIKSSSEIMLLSRTPVERQMLITRLRHAAENNTTYKEHRIAQQSSEMQHTERKGSDLAPVSAQDPAGARQASSFAPAEADDTTNLRSRISALKSASASIQSPNLASPYRIERRTPLLLRILERLQTIQQSNAGLHQQQLADALGVDVEEIAKAAEHLKTLGLVHTVFGSSDTWVATAKSEAGSALARQPEFSEFREAKQEAAEEWSESEPELSPKLGPSEEADLLSSGIEDMDIAKQPRRPSGSPQNPSEATGSRSALRVVDLSISGLSNINIDDYYTYIAPPTSASAQTPDLPATRSHSSPSPTSAGPSVAPSRPQPRWTKLDRLLVNPSALRELNEDFEEIGDSLIVKREVGREEIMAFAARTREIRRA